MAKIKIAFDANPLVGQKTGIGQLTYELILALAKDNPDKNFIGHYFNFLNKKDVSDLPNLNNISYKKTILLPTKILNILRRINLQLPFEFFCRVHADTILFTNFVSQPSLFKSKKVLFVHDLSFEDFPEFVSEKNGAYLRKWVKSSINSSQEIVTISEFTKQRIIDVYSIEPEKIKVMAIPPKPVTIADNSILDNLGLKDFLLFVGTLEPRKNILGLLNSYELLSNDIQDKYPLVLVGGKGWKDEAIIEKIESMKKNSLSVIQTGYVTDQEKSSLYKASTVVVQLSHYEGFGMPVLEAMSYGKPVICSDIPVFHEIAKNSVIYVNKDNPTEVAEAIKKLLTDKPLGEELSKKSMDYVNNYPKWQEVAKSLSPLLDSK